MIASGFKDWFNREDLKLWDVRHEGGHIARIYKNMRTGFGFAHEFTNAAQLEMSYLRVKEKYDRRIKRFDEKMLKSKRVLMIYMELPVRPRTDDENLIKARDIIAEKYSGCDIELLYLYDDPLCATAEECASFDGITIIKAHYSTVKNGKIHHVADRAQFSSYLRQNITVSDAMTDKELHSLAAEKRRKYYKSLGNNWLERRINKKLTQWYRDLELYLIGEGLIPCDHATWFFGDGK